MSEIQMTTLDGGQARITADALQALTASLRGELVGPTASSYDRVRTIWNAMIDKRPGLILRAAGAADVIQGVRFAREHRLQVAVRGGGHNIAGSALSEGGLVIDLSQMKSVRVDPVARTARVEPGALLADVDCETQQFGLALPVGINSTTGIAGLTLGGGFGWLSRKFGMTIDNLLSADVVTAAGELLTASEKEHADLFWGIRGGGGNFGVVTSFKFRLHPVGPQVLAGLVVHPLSAARSALAFYRDFSAAAPDELTTWVVLRKAPPLPFLPAAVHGTEVLVFAALYSGSLVEGERALQPLRQFGTPLGDVIGPNPYTGWQKAFDPLLAPGMRNYWKSHNFTTLADGLLDTLVEWTRKLPSPHSEIFIGQLGGAQGRVAADTTAYPHRDARYVMNLHTRWEAPSDDRRCIDWAREFFAATAVFATGGVYSNFMPADEGDRIGAAYGPALPRLTALKDKYDPLNLFRLNQNVRPSKG